MAHRFKLSLGGLDRTYLVYQPTSLSRTLAAPLVIVLHGYNGSGAGIEETAGFDAQADGGGFLVVYPDGYSSSWNTGDLIGEAGTVGVDDVVFIDAVIAAVERTHRIDHDRIYATGISQGAVIAHHLGCDLSSRFAAIASMEGALWGRSCRPTQPVSVLQIHGTADTVVPYPGMVRKLVGTVLVDKNISTVDLWRQLDGCKGPPLREVASIVVKDIYTNCQAGAT